jgi:hypothetical protein
VFIYVDIYAVVCKVELGSIVGRERWKSVDERKKERKKKKEKRRKRKRKTCKD